MSYMQPKPGRLGFFWIYTAQLCGDYNKSIVNYKDPY